MSQVYLNSTITQKWLVIAHNRANTIDINADNTGR